MADPSFDVVIVGTGPGGYVAAIRASQLGLKTAVVEREHLGGICLNWGCIPTKALLRVSELRHTLDRLGDFGISVGEVSVDIEKIVARSREVADQLSRGVAYLMKKNGITVIEGHARLAGSGTLEVTKEDGAVETVRAAHIILATGARARVLPGLEPDGETIWTYKEAMVPAAHPASLLVIGAGAIGMEFASFYADLGSAVTVVEILPRVLPVEDEEISAAALKAFEAQGMTIHTGARVNSLAAKGGAVQAAIETADGKTENVTFDRAILAAGIIGNVEDIGLEGTGVVVEKGHIQTDPWMATGEPGVYAIGDVTGPPWLAHKASHEGVLCVEKIAGVGGVHTAGHQPRAGLHILPAPGRLGRAHRSRGQGGGARGQGRALPLHRQRQGDRAGRARGHGQDRVRRGDRRAARRPHDRHRGDRADPGLHGRPLAGVHRGGPCRDDLPAPHIIRGDARIGA